MISVKPAGPSGVPQEWNPAHHVLAGRDGDRGPSRVRQPGKTSLWRSGEFCSILTISVNDIKFHLELMSRPTVATGQQLKATVWDLGMMVISITEQLIQFLDNIMYKCAPR
jgi:hypothetical protein